MTNDKHEVLLYVYDMSKGMAKSLSMMFLGKQIEGIWHTAIVAFGREYFFGGGGIANCPPCSTMMGQPDEVISLGHSHIPYELFIEYLQDLSTSTFAGHRYNLIENNCNNFSHELAQFLTGRGIPDKIINLPNDFLSTPLGQIFGQQLAGLQITPEGQSVQQFQQQAPPIETTPAVSTQETSLKKDQIEVTPKVQQEESNKMADTQPQRDDSPDIDDKEVKLTPRKVYKFDDPPIVFKEVDGVEALHKVEEMVINLLDPAQQQLLKEIGDYMSGSTGAWAVGDEHIELICFLLNGGEGKFAPNVTLLTLEFLQAAALKDDIVLILHQDRKDHLLMSYINKIENLTLAEQEEIVKLLCNLCGQPSTFDWLLYISEWCETDGQQASNSRVTTRAAVHTLLNEALTTLQHNGVCLIFNLALKELFEDVAIELATAIIQFLHGDLSTEQAEMCLVALTRFVELSQTDIPALIKMLGPDMNKFKGKNDKIDGLVDDINQRLARLPSFG